MIYVGNHEACSAQYQVVVPTRRKYRRYRVWSVAASFVKYCLKYRRYVSEDTLGRLLRGAWHCRQIDSG
eukprot:2175927-Pleurochrysis_carterae.AAC.2